MQGSRRLCSAREFYLVLTVCFLLQIQADQPTTYQYLVNLSAPLRRASNHTCMAWSWLCLWVTDWTLGKTNWRFFWQTSFKSHIWIFEVGYLEIKNNGKRWIEDCADLTAMYHIFLTGSTVTIWGESKDDSTSTDITTTASAGRKSKVSSKKDTGDSSSKRTSISHEEDVDEFVEKLRKKHLGEGKYSEPQLRLWARMLARGHHQSLDDPPNIPLITGISNKEDT